MSTVEQIILVILAAALAIFITTAIVAVVYVIRLVKTLQAIAQKAENLVDSAETVGTMMKQAVGRLSVLQFVRTVVNLVHKSK
jgi:cell division protein FtsB